MGIWKEQGMRKLQTVLIQIGMPLKAAKTAYSMMSPRLKNLLDVGMEKFSAEHGLGGSKFESFSRQIGRTMEVSASDMISSVTALLGHSAWAAGVNTDDDDFAAELRTDMLGKDTFHERQGASWENNFWRAYDALESHNSQLLRFGLRSSIVLQQAL